MNLLNYQNRFKTLPFAPENVDKVNGYLYCLQDLLKYMEQLTEFNPSKRFIDSVDILNAITETNAALKEVSKRHETQLTDSFKTRGDLASEKVKEFLKDQII